MPVNLKKKISSSYSETLKFTRGISIGSAFNFCLASPSHFLKINFKYFLVNLEELHSNYPVSSTRLFRYKGVNTEKKGTETQFKYITFMETLPEGGRILCTQGPISHLQCVK